MVSHAHQGTTSSALTRLSVNVARLLGIPPHGYAHLLGLAPEHLNDDLCRTPAATSIRIAELTTVHAPWTEMSVLLAQQSSIGSLGVWDYLITSAPTPLEGIRDASAYFATVADIGTDNLRITEDGEHVTISHVNEADLTYEAACAIRAYALGLYQRRLSEAARQRLIPLRVSLAAKAPRRHHALTELYGTRGIEFEAPASSITFLASDLNTPTPHAQPGLSTVLRRHADQTLATAIPLHNWLDLFRTALASAHDETTPTLSAVAGRMTVSPRTLQRRLDEHGTTWSHEVETVRRDHVTRLLHGTDLSVESVATRSGYADARALRRAVQRWYGTTPATLRRTGRPDSGATGLPNIG
ncbi:AraC family transcriptional regulator ligand-binding domain-containing protein [Streptomyces sp. ISL-43]|uniref:AraC family transcriptional regulator ligand-binding domain-containing protein n=1 Tax=Streptomyces sp. ISL-43 TaxID=2819183 RepID=UPI001BE6DF07|nr:AraC family transcriptional regulator ligand-binding domain-containing protein [Streptomyces sp. ISL-43]MBT2450877.1 AraC family transcriptional regulator ligand-binding domain-containing protein [Streptomyces sp. ISL-43]